MVKIKSAGFSLVELIIVVAIMAILIGVLAPQYVKYVEKSRVAKDRNVTEALLSVAYTMIADEEVVNDLNDGDTIVYSATGITVDPANAKIDDALSEKLERWQNKKVSSKSYATQKYVISFTYNSTLQSFYTDGKWVPN